MADCTLSREPSTTRCNEKLNQTYSSFPYDNLREQGVSIEQTVEFKIGGLFTKLTLHIILTLTFKQG